MTGVKVDKTLIKIKKGRNMKECWLCKHKKNIAKVLYNTFIFVVLYNFLALVNHLPFFESLQTLEIEMTLENFGYLFFTIDGVLNLVSSVFNIAIVFLIINTLVKNASQYINFNEKMSRAVRYCSFWNPLC